MLFAYEPAMQPNADFLKSKLGDQVRLERFDWDGHALFVDDPVRFNRMVEQFVQSLPDPPRLARLPATGLLRVCVQQLCELFGHFQ